MEFLFVISSILFLITAVSYLWSIIWSYKDAVSRGSNGLIVAIIVAFGAWPFGLFFWTVSRPEIISGRKKKSSPKRSNTPNKYLVVYKKMPWFLKLLTLGSIYSLITTLINFAQMKPVNFIIFNSEFFINNPAIWYLYYSLMGIAAITVYFKRSYSLLKKYVYILLGIIFALILNTTYITSNLPSEQVLPTITASVFTYGFAVLVYTYLLQQKKYFNKK